MHRRPSSTVAKPLSGRAPDSLILFVAGEPQSTPDLRESTVGMGERLVGLIVPGAGIPARELRPGSAENPSSATDIGATPSSDPRPWHLPPSQTACLDIVLDTAERQREEVLVVDVDRPGEHRDLVERYVGSNDVLPLLLRPDGARLEGLENFTPARVRKFIATR